jgi:hypothetical protein
MPLHQSGNDGTAVAFIWSPATPRLWRDLAKPVREKEKARPTLLPGTGGRASMSSKPSFYGAILPAARPAVRTALPVVAGTAIGLVAGGAYGLLCGALYGAAHHTFQPVLAGGVWCALAGAAAGTIMGVCAALDRALKGKRPGPQPAPGTGPRASTGAVNGEVRWGRRNGTCPAGGHRAFGMVQRDDSPSR